MSSSTTNSMNMNAAGTSKRKPGWWYPWIFVAFFAVIVTVNGIMMYFAYSSWTGLETKDHYLKGLAYDDNVNGARAQEALGWTVTLSVKTDAKQGDKRTVSYQATFLDHNNKPVDQIKAHAFFLRPTHDGSDQDAEAQLIQPGVVGGTLDLAHPGNWMVRIHAVSQGRQYQHVERVVVP